MLVALIGIPKTTITTTATTTTTMTATTTTTTTTTAFTSKKNLRSSEIIGLPLEVSLFEAEQHGSYAIR
ncbi:unnamed protein product [Rotaria sp. Silwood2]|nr:unnamed protein product [Rotaria sp. Silwood2]